MHGELVGGGIADDATFADMLAACFELGLDEEDGFAVPGFSGWDKSGNDSGEDERRGDEADVHGEEGDGLGFDMGGGRCRSLHFALCASVEMKSLRVGELAGGEKAGVGSFEE